MAGRLEQLDALVRQPYHSCMENIVREVAKRVGGVPELARRLGISRQAIYQWEAIPAEKVQAIAHMTGLPKAQLRPDLFGGMPDGRNAASADYDEDYVAWIQDQVGALRAREFGRLDLVNLIDEVEDMAQRQRDEIENRLGILLKHLLKWKYQPEARSNSWAATMLEQRARISRRIARSPSLRAYPAAVLDEEYAIARREAALETGIPLDRFPPQVPFTIEDVLDLDFLPASDQEGDPS